MSNLVIYNDTNPDNIIYSTQDSAKISAKLSEIGINYEHWGAQQLSNSMSDDEVLKAYSNDIDRLKSQAGYQSVDIVRFTPDNAQKCELRKKFLSEHTHSEDEVRFFVEGSGMFYLHVAGKVYMVLCKAGDLISVPSNAKHWFDMGENPQFTCIRLFTSADGWAANYTGDNIADNFPKFDEDMEDYYYGSRDKSNSN